MTNDSVNKSRSVSLFDALKEALIKEGLINSSETVGGFRGASEDALAPNELCPPELLISLSLNIVHKRAHGSKVRFGRDLT